MTWALQRDEVQELYPFFLAVSQDGKIIDFGRSLAKYLPDLSWGKRFDEIFEIKLPDVRSFAEIVPRPTAEAIVICSKAKPMRFKGMVQRSGQGKDVFLFCTSPFLTDLKDALDAKLHFGDFSLADPIFDFLMLVQSERRANEVSKEALALAEQKSLENKEASYLLELEIAAREATEQSLKAAKEQAETSNRAKSQFLANMSHEIRTPLNGIIGITSLLAETKLDEEQQSYVDKVRLSGDHLLGVINDILDFSKIEAGELSLEKIDFPLESIITEVKDIFSEKAKEKGLDISVDVKLEPGFRVVGDPLRVRQVLLNLVGNALKFTEKGHIRFGVLFTNEGQQNIGVVRMYVEDSGIGMPAEKLDLLFKPFSQLDTSHARKFGGSGLGLVITRKLLQLMGGDIFAQSEHGKGTRFDLHFKADAATKQSSKEQVITTAAQMPQTHLRILLAEDNAINQELVKSMIKKLGHTLTTVDNGKRALDEFQKNFSSYDLILMDCQMPEMDGFEATKQIRKLQINGPKTPIIAMTANTMRGDQERCLEAGMDDYLSKPMKLKEFASMIEKWEKIHVASKANQSPSQQVPADLLNDSALEMIFELSQHSGESLLNDTIGSFIRDAKKNIDELKSYLNKGDFKSSRFYAHKFKSSCDVVGAQALSKICSTIELDGDETLHKEFGRYVSDLEYLCDLTIEALKNKLPKPTTTTAA